MKVKTWMTKTRYKNLLLCKAMDCFSSLAACIAPYKIWELVVRDDTPRSVLIWIPLGPCPVSDFSNMDLPSSSERQPRAMAITYMVWGVSWILLTNNTKGHVSYLTQSFVWVILWLLEKYYHSLCYNSMETIMYTHIYTYMIYVFK